MADPISNAQSESVQEEWHPVVGWEGLYEVSSLGRVRSLDRFIIQACSRGEMRRVFPGRILKLNTRVDLYKQVSLSRQGELRHCLVHILVCEASHGPKPDGHEVAHWDGNRANNKADNLRWATSSENNSDTERHGNRLFGERHPRAKITAYQARRLREATDRFALRALAKELGITPGHARTIHRGAAYRLT